MAALKRIRMEISEIKKRPSSHFTVTYDNKNIFEWNVVLNGPPDSVYEGGKFKMTLHFPQNYPFSAPKVKFVTKIYHPNITEDTGFICLDILSGNWSPAYTASKVLMAISSFLIHPDSEMVSLRTGVHLEYLYAKDTFIANARSCTRKHAMDHLSEEEKDQIQSKRIDY